MRGIPIYSVVTLDSGNVACELSQNNETYVWGRAIIITIITVVIVIIIITIIIIIIINIIIITIITIILFCRWPRVFNV